MIAIASAIGRYIKKASAARAVAAVPADQVALEADPAEDKLRFRAFISYRHVDPDRAYAKWLQSVLETYRIPRSFAQVRGIPSRLGRIFRDEEELAASPNLSTAIEDALRASHYLIIICSPAAAASQWVNAEVEFFRKLGRADRILSLLIVGEPCDAFPPALYEIRPAPPRPSIEPSLAEPAEPLAADVRSNIGGSERFRKRIALLRLVATLIGCRFDDLRQRDQERRQRRIVGMAVAATGSAVFLAGLAGYAVLQRNEAVAQRDNAISRSLAARSQLLVTQRGTLIDTASLLAVASIKMAPSLEADLAIRKVLSLLPRRIAEINCARKANVTEGIFSKDGKYLATTTGDNTTQVWNTATGRLVSNIPVSISKSAMFRPDSNELASLQNDIVYIWDVNTGAPVSKLAGINDFQYDSSGAFLVAAGPDKLTRVFDASDYAEVAHIANREAMTSVSVAREAREIIASNQNLSEVFRSPGAPAQILPSSVFPESFTYSPDGNYLARKIPAQYLVRLMDTRSRESLLFAERHWASAFSGNSEVFAVGSPEWDATTYDLTTCNRAGERWEPTSRGMLEKTYVTGRGTCQALSTVHHDDSITGVELSWDGALLATTSRDRTVRVWETARGREALRISEAMEGEIRGVSFSRDARLLSAWGPKGCHTWESRGPRQIAALEQDDAISGIGFSGDGSKVAMVDVTDFRSPTARVWTIPAGQEVGRLEVTPLSWHSVALNQDGTKMLLDNTAVWQVTPSKQLYNLAPAKSLSSPAKGPSLSADWRTGVVARDASTVIVYGTQDGRELAHHATPDTSIELVALAPDGCCVAIATTRGKLVFWRWATNQEEIFAGIVSKPRKIIFSRKGAFLAMIGGREQNLVQTLRIRERKPAILFAHETKVHDAAFNSTGQYLATAGDDKWARVWEVRTGRLVAQLLHDADVDSIAFSPDDKYVLSGGGRSDRTGRLWLWRPADLIDETCLRLKRKSLTREEWENYVGSIPPYRETCSR
jgi:WD40 repeat protein